MATDLSPEELAYLQERKAAAQQGAAPVQQAPAQPVAKPIAGNVIPAEQTAPTSQAAVGSIQQPSAVPINYGPMISNVSSAYRNLKQQAPSVVESLDASMPWLKYAAGLIGAGIVGSKLLGQEKSNKSSGIQARSIVKTEPQMDISVRQPDGRIEPTLDVVEQNIGEKPTILSTQEAATQAAQEQVKQGKIKTGKAGGTLSTQGSQILHNASQGQAVSDVTETVGKPPPEGWRSQYERSKKNPIGPGGFNYIAGQYGPEEAKIRWEEQYGKKNVPYEQVVSDFGASKRPEHVSAEGKKGGGSFKKPEFVPEYIRGSAPVEAMARSGLAALGILPVAQKIKQGDYKGALNEAIPAMAMIAPALSLAASPLYTSEEEMKILKNAEQKRKVGAGRGIAPPSDYMR